MTSQTDILEARVVVHGRVQGVAFRMFVREKAVQCRVTGWVKNTPDGTVEAVLQGPKDAIEKMIHWVHEGPTLARVTHVDTCWQEVHQQSTQFEIKY